MLAVFGVVAFSAARNHAAKAQMDAPINSEFYHTGIGHNQLKIISV